MLVLSDMIVMLDVFHIKFSCWIVDMFFNIVNVLNMNEMFDFLALCLKKFQLRCMRPPCHGAPTQFIFNIFFTFLTFFTFL